ncbi:MAG: hypothetical protein AB7E84_00295 [Xanthobacteraceae bacterium]
MALPSGVTTTSTTLMCCQELSVEEWRDVGRVLAQAEIALQFWLGDWWRFGQHSYGQRVALVAAKNAFGRGYAFSTLANFGWVAGAVEASRRREVLSWSIHAEVARLSPERQIHWLDTAVRDKLSVSKLRRMVSEERYNDIAPPTEDRRSTNYFRRLLGQARLPVGEQLTPFYNSPEAKDHLRSSLDHWLGRQDFAELKKAFEDAENYYRQGLSCIREIEAEMQARVASQPEIIRVEVAIPSTPRVVAAVYEDDWQPPDDDAPRPPCACPRCVTWHDSSPSPN